MCLLSVMDITIMKHNGYLSLLQALDPLFPIGTFTLSNGLETYVQKNLVYNTDTLRKFMNAYIYTLPNNDLGFAAKAAMGASCKMLDERYTASKSPFELRSGCKKQCSRFLKAETKLGDYYELEHYADMIATGICNGCYPVALGLLIKDTGTDIIQGLEMYCYNLLSSMVNHAVKLVPLRQLDGQQCLSMLMEEIPHTVQKAIEMESDDLGFSGMGFDFRSMQHETLYARLYLS